VSGSHHKTLSNFLTRPFSKSIRIVSYCYQAILLCKVLIHVACISCLQLFLHCSRQCTGSPRRSPGSVTWGWVLGSLYPHFLLRPSRTACTRHSLIGTMASQNPSLGFLQCLLVAFLFRLACCACFLIFVSLMPYECADIFVWIQLVRMVCRGQDSLDNAYHRLWDFWSGHDAYIVSHTFFFFDSKYDLITCLVCL
jgi:hypothetical protein